MMATSFSSWRTRHVPTRARVRTPKSGKRMTPIRRGSSWDSLRTNSARRRIQRMLIRGIMGRRYQRATRWQSLTKTHQRSRGSQVQPYRRTIPSLPLQPRLVPHSLSRRSTMQSPRFCALFLEQRREVRQQRRELDRADRPPSKPRRTRGSERRIEDSGPKLTRSGRRRRS